LPAPYREPLADKIQRLSKLDPETGCINWCGTVGKAGYGYLSTVGRMNYRAHRVSYELAKGKIPDGLQIDHLCRNRRCVNPEHLEAVTAGENTRRSRLFVSVHTPEINEKRRRAMVAKTGVLVTFNGETMHVRAWAQRLGIGHATLSARLHRWPIERAMTAPVRPRRKSPHRLRSRGFQKSDELK